MRNCYMRGNEGLTRNFTLQDNTAHNEGNDTNRAGLRKVSWVYNRGNCFASYRLTYASHRILLISWLTFITVFKRIIFRSWWGRTFLRRSGDNATWSSVTSRRYTSFIVSISYGNWNSANSRQWTWDNASSDTWVFFFLSNSFLDLLLNLSSSCWMFYFTVLLYIHVAGEKILPLCTVQQEQTKFRLPDGRVRHRVLQAEATRARWQDGPC